jgi:hypothetical protein
VQWNRASALESYYRYTTSFEAYYRYTTSFKRITVTRLLKRITVTQHLLKRITVTQHLLKRITVTHAREIEHFTLTLSLFILYAYRRFVARMVHFPLSYAYMLAGNINCSPREIVEHALSDRRYCIPVQHQINKLGLFCVRKVVKFLLSFFEFGLFTCYKSFLIFVVTPLLLFNRETRHLSQITAPHDTQSCFPYSH